MGKDEVKNYIENFIQPRIQGDGGWVEFDKLDGSDLFLTFRGECSKCLILNRCVDWIKSELKNNFGTDFNITYKRIKPYFQDI